MTIFAAELPGKPLPGTAKVMGNEENEAREKAIEVVSGLMRRRPFSLEFAVTKRPRGLVMIYEMTADEMVGLTKMMAEEGRENETDKEQ